MAILKDRSDSEERVPLESLTLEVNANILLTFKNVKNISVLECKLYHSFFYIKDKINYF